MIIVIVVFISSNYSKLQVILKRKREKYNLTYIKRNLFKMRQTVLVNKLDKHLT